MRTEVIIGKIKNVKQLAAVQLLESPKGKDPFDYGAACGIATGLEMAIGIILEDAKEAENEGGRFDG